MNAAFASPVQLRLQATFARHVLDSWREPFAAFPAWHECGEEQTTQEFLEEVEVTYLTHDETGAEQVIYVENLLAEDGPRWLTEPHPNFFYQRERKEYISPIVGKATLDVLDIGRVAIERGELKLGNQTFTAWEKDGLVSAEPGEMRQFLSGEEMNALPEGFFLPGLPVSLAEWWQLVKETPFIRTHSRSQRRSGFSLPMALANPTDFLDWVQRLPEEKKEQLMVSPRIKEALRQASPLPGAAVAFA